MEVVYITDENCANNFDPTQLYINTFTYDTVQFKCDGYSYMKQYIAYKEKERIYQENVSLGVDGRIDCRRANGCEFEDTTERLQYNEDYYPKITRPYCCTENLYRDIEAQTVVLKRST